MRSPGCPGSFSRMRWIRGQHNEHYPEVILGLVSNVVPTSSRKASESMTKPIPIWWARLSIAVSRVQPESDARVFALCYRQVRPHDRGLVGREFSRSFSPDLDTYIANTTNSRMSSNEEISQQLHNTKDSLKVAVYDQLFHPVFQAWYKLSRLGGSGLSELTFLFFSNRCKAILKYIVILSIEYICLSL